MAGIFKAYDIRGTYPDQLDERLAARIGAAVVEVLGAKRLVIGDMHAEPPTRAMMPPSPTPAARSSTSASAAPHDLLGGERRFSADAGDRDPASHSRPVTTAADQRPRRHPSGYDTGIADIERLALSDTPAAPPPARRGEQAPTLLSDYHQRWLLSFRRHHQTASSSSSTPATA